MSSRTLAVVIISSLMLSALSSSFASSAANTIRWKVEGERGVYGFLVYRALRSEGPFRRVTSDIMPATGKLRYTVVDSDVRSGETYFYVIYSVGTNGVKQSLTPVVAKQTR